MSSDYGLKISKSGVDVQTAVDKSLTFSTQFDTFKIALTGTLTLSLPGETLNPGGSVTRSSTVAHGLGYAPMWGPIVEKFDNPGYGNTTTWVLNDAVETAIPVGAYGPVGLEVAHITVNTTVLTLSVTRSNVGLGPESYGAHDVKLYYTIFHNKIEETFDLT